MPEIKIEIGQSQTRAVLVPGSYNEAENTVEVTICTDQPVRMYDYSNGCFFNEVLDFGGTSIRTKRLDAGLPLLDNHQKYGDIRKGAVMGKLIKWSVQTGNRIIGTLKLSGIKSLEEFREQVREGTVDFLSAGYFIYKYMVEQPATENNIATYRAIDWEPYEVSFAIIPADVDSSTRSIQNFGTEKVVKYEVAVESKDVINVSTNNSRTMPQLTPAEQAERTRSVAIITAVNKAGLDNSIAERMINDEAITVDNLQTNIDAEVQRKITPPTPPVPPTSPANDQAGIDAERARSVAIHALLRNAKIEGGQEIAERMIKDGTTVENAQAEVIRMFTDNDPNKGAAPANGAVTGADEETTLRNRMSDAILLNAGSDVKLDAPAVEAAREFRGRTMLDISRHFLTFKGIDVKNLNNRELAERALSTGEFTNILGNTVNRSLRAAYNVQRRTFTDWARRVDSKDFRPSKRVKLSGIIGSVDEIPENGEYPIKSLSDGAETMQIAKYGQMIMISMEAMVNDDLGAFARVPQAIAYKFAGKQSALFYSTFLGSGNMSDGLPIFHATHANLAGAGTIIDATNLGLARKAMRIQTDEDGEYLDLMPAFLLVGPNKETEALQLTSAAYLPNTANEVNPWKSLQIVVEPRITGNEWFLIANNGAVDTMEYGFLQGEQELYTEQKTGFNIDGVAIKARMCFGVAAIDYRGLYKNPGA